MSRGVSRILGVLLSFFLVVVLSLPALAQDVPEPPINWDMIDPTLTFPSGIDTLSDPRPVFTWEAVALAVRYEIQITETTTFLYDLIERESVSGLSFQTSEPLEDDTYLWRVRGVDNNGAVSPWSDIRRLTIDTLAPDVPELLVPAADAQVTDAAPWFQWTPSFGADRYLVVIDTDNACDAEAVTASGASLQVAESFVQGAYFWCVTAIDAADNASDQSEASAFTINITTAPADGEIIFTTTEPYTPTLRWDAIAGVEGYTLQLDTSQGMTGAAEAAVGAVDRYTWGDGLSYGVYYWQVIPDGLAQEDAVVSRFVISPPAPTAPTLEAPASGEALDSVPVRLRWSDVDTTLTYEVEITRTNAETPDVSAATVTGNSYDFTLSGALPDEPDVYTWRVRALNAYDVPGAWSAAGSFTLASGG